MVPDPEESLDGPWCRHFQKAEPNAKPAEPARDRFFIVLDQNA
jgi:hypothetical protein